MTLKKAEPRVLRLTYNGNGALMSDLILPKIEPLILRLIGYGNGLVGVELIYRCDDETEREMQNIRESW